MSFGGPALKQHVVEFIRGTGVITDGVTNPNYGGGGTNGPWNWTVPDGVASIELGITSGGQGGGGGGDPTGAISVGGGGGGMGGGCWYSYGVSIVPNSTLVITLGAGGTGGAIGGQGTVGGTTTVDGILGAYSDAQQSAPAGGATTGRVSARQMTEAGSNFGLASPSTFGSGGAGSGGLGGGTTPGGTSSGAAGTNGLHGSNYTTWWVYPIGTQAVPIHCWPGSGGSAGNASGSVAGGGNQYTSRSFISGGGNAQEQTLNPRGGTGNTTGSLSRGGGGCGGNNLFGYGGRGGDGGVDGGPGIGYGGGGGGGGGGGAGGGGGNGYVRFTYWSAE